MSLDSPEDREGAKESPRKLVSQKDLLQQALRRIIHDARNPLMCIKQAVSIVRMQPLEARAIDIIERNVWELERQLHDAHDEEPTPRNVGDFHEILRDLLDRLAESGMAMPQIEIRSCPEDLATYTVPVNSAMWHRMLANIIQNATRKGASKITITCEKAVLIQSQSPGIQVTMEDDGAGMPPEILEKILGGMQVSDKDFRELPPGDSPERHGQGLLSVRRCIEVVSMGEMHVESRQATEEDPTHGTKILLRLPLLQNGHPHAASPASVRPWSRRDILKWGVVAGSSAAVAGAGGYVALHNRSDSRGESLRSLNIGIEDRKIRSFVLESGERTIRYERGGTHQGLKSAHEIDTPECSLVILDASSESPSGFDRLFIMRLEHGFFGYLKGLARGHTQTFYLCTTHEEVMRGSLREHIFPLEDVIHTRNPAWEQGAPETLNRYQAYATNVSLLLDSVFAQMEPDLRMIPKRPELAEFGNDLALRMEPILRTRDLSDRIVSVDTRADWRRETAGSGKLLIVKRSVVEELMQHPLRPEQTWDLLQRDIHVGMRGTHPREVSSVVHQ